MTPSRDFDEACERLRARGLNASFDSNQQVVRVYRSPDVPGNRREHFSDTLLLSLDPLIEVKLDAPIGWLSQLDCGEWFFQIAACVPRGPGDHAWTYANLNEAVEVVADYYFGDDLRMCADWDAAIDAGIVRRD